MGKKHQPAIDALFGSKTRVKLLYLFLNNPGKAFYVREITRLIDEQINSVRRELSNMLSVGIIESNTSENKLYYEINQRYGHYRAFRAIFAGIDESKSANKTSSSALADTTAGNWQRSLAGYKGLRIVIAAGALVKGSASSVDLLLVGTISPRKLQSLIKTIEDQDKRRINYSVLSYDEFYYRLSVRDKFINEILSNKHEVALDTDSVLVR